MKRIIVFIFCTIAVSIIFSACTAYEKCPAYGHYTQVETATIDDEQL